MAWEIEFTRQAERQLEKISKPEAKRIVAYMENIAKKENPRQSGAMLRYENYGFWRYRVGKYRIVCRIEENVLTILAVRVGHRGEVYKQPI